MELCKKLNSISAFKRLFIIGLVLVVIFMILNVIRMDYTRNFNLGGTYVCKETPFDFISFDIDGSNKFKYYYNRQQSVDSGTFKKVSDGIYLLNSSQFKNQKIKCFKKFPSENGFNIKVNGVNMKFMRMSDIPSEIVLSEKSKQ